MFRLSPVPTKGKVLPEKGKYKPSTTAELLSLLLLATYFGFRESHHEGIKIH
jgi:hypothetical protein